MRPLAFVAMLAAFTLGACVSYKVAENCCGDYCHPETKCYMHVEYRNGGSVRPVDMPTSIDYTLMEIWTGPPWYPYPYWRGWQWPNK